MSGAADPASVRRLQTKLGVARGVVSLKAVVTGATGFIGPRLVARLLAEGWSLLAIVQPGDMTPLPDSVLVREDVGTAAADAAMLMDFAPDVVIHLAACQDLTDAPEAVDALIEANVAFGARMLAASAAAGARGFVAAGTFMSHADGTEDYAPQTMYAATKQAFRDLGAHYNRWTRLRVTTLELSDTYGPGDPRPKFLNLVAASARSGEVLDATPGEQTVRPLHVDDVADAFLHAATMLGEGSELEDVYSLHGADAVTLQELVALFTTATGLSPHVRFGGRPYRSNEIMAPYVGESLPGWAPSIELERGLREVFGDPALR
jgi:nucleoside-diphosphate-sugar epimerase